MINKRLIVKALTAVFLTTSIFLITAIQIKAQQNPPPKNSSTSPEKTNEEVADADVLIIANITAKELKFEIVPNPKVEFSGKPERKTLWEADRQNLPQSVEPGVTYRNVGIRLRIASRFADIERIVAEALGEIPVTDDAPKVQPTNQSPVSDSSKNQTPKTGNQTIKQTKPRQ